MILAFAFVTQVFQAMVKWHYWHPLLHQKHTEHQCQLSRRSQTPDISELLFLYKVSWLGLCHLPTDVLLLNTVCSTTKHYLSSPNYLMCCCPSELFCIGRFSTLLILGIPTCPSKSVLISFPVGSILASSQQGRWPSPETPQQLIQCSIIVSISCLFYKYTKSCRES